MRQGVEVPYTKAHSVVAKTISLREAAPILGCKDAPSDFPSDRLAHGTLCEMFARDAIDRTS